MDGNRSCHAKKRYSTEAYAAGVIEKCQKERPGFLRSYYCKLCLGWHLTSQEKRA